MNLIIAPRPPQPQVLDQNYDILTSQRVLRLEAADRAAARREQKGRRVPEGQFQHNYSDEGNHGGFSSFSFDKKGGEWLSLKGVFKDG